MHSEHRTRRGIAAPSRPLQTATSRRHPPPPTPRLSRPLHTATSRRHPPPPTPRLSRPLHKATSRRHPPPPTPRLSRPLHTATSRSTPPNQPRCSTAAPTPLVLFVLFCFFAGFFTVVFCEPPPPSVFVAIDFFFVYPPHSSACQSNFFVSFLYCIPSPFFCVSEELRIVGAAMKIVLRVLIWCALCVLRVPGVHCVFAGCIHTIAHTQTYAHTHTHAHTHAYTHTHTYAHMHTHTHAHAHTHTYFYTHSRWCSTHACILLLQLHTPYTPPTHTHTDTFLSLALSSCINHAGIPLLQRTETFIFSLSCIQFVQQSRRHPPPPTH